MRKLSFLLLASMVVFAACNNNKTKEATIVSDDGKTKVTIDPTTTQSNTDEMTRKMEELKKLTPMTTDQLKAMLPEEIMGLKRTNFNATSAMGWGTANATYRNEGDDKQIELTVIDCAGEAGSGIYTLNYWTMLSYESENESGYNKTVDFNGQRAVESYHKSNDQYELTFLSGDRLLVTVKGEKTGLDAVKEVAKSLKM